VPSLAGKIDMIPGHEHELPFQAAWADASFDGHAASAVVSQFREYLRRFA